MAKLIVMCGLPGSGKSTIAKLYEKYEDYTRVCLDDFRVQLFDDINIQEGLVEADKITKLYPSLKDYTDKVARVGDKGTMVVRVNGGILYDMAKELIVQNINKGNNVVYDDTNLSHRTKLYTEIYSKCNGNKGVEIKLLYPKYLDFDVILQRNMDRKQRNMDNLLLKIKHNELEKLDFEVEVPTPTLYKMYLSYIKNSPEKDYIDKDTYDENTYKEMEQKYKEIGEKEL